VVWRKRTLRVVCFDKDHCKCKSPLVSVKLTGNNDDLFAGETATVLAVNCEKLFHHSLSKKTNLNFSTIGVQLLNPESKLF